MIKKNVTRLIGLKKADFDLFVKTGQIQVQEARLIPTLKTGDEMALTSIFLTALKLVKEYRDGFFKEIKLSRGGKSYYFTEASFPDIDKSRIDGLIIIVIKGIISDAAFFEMKNKNNGLGLPQIEKYLDISKKLKVSKLITVSNEFVSDPSRSPIKVKSPKSISLSHFSWTYLITKGQLLVFDNDTNIVDPDQVEIMKEVLHYFENPISGISGYTQMKAGWRELVENIRAQKPLKISDLYIEEAVLSWYEEEKDMALMLSRKLGVLVKSSSKNKDSIKNDIKRVVKENNLTGLLSIKNSVSSVKIVAEFERRVVAMSVKVSPPLDKGSIARITWIGNQMANCKKKEGDLFIGLENDLWVEAEIKYAKSRLKVKLSDLGSLQDSAKGKEVQAFHIVLIKSFGSAFASNKKFVSELEKMVLAYYEATVQHLSNWSRPAPKLNQVD